MVKFETRSNGHVRYSILKKADTDHGLNSRHCTKNELLIWSHLLEKSLMKNFIFCAVKVKNCIAPFSTWYVASFGTIWTIKKRENNHGGVLLLVKLHTKACDLKVTPLHGCLSHFLNCINGTKSLKPSHINVLVGSLLVNPFNVTGLFLYLVKTCFQIL